MLCLRCSRGINAVSRLPIASHTAQRSMLDVTSKRTFTSFSPLRPSLFPASRAFRPSLPSTLTSHTTPTALTTATAETPLDLLPKISTHPALASTQVRCGPRNTFDPSHFVRKRRHGFLSRIRTRNGRNTLRRRRKKGRNSLSH